MYTLAGERESKWDVEKEEGAHMRMNSEICTQLRTSKFLRID